MPEEEIQEEVNEEEGEEEEGGSSEPQPRGRFRLSANALRILKVVLNYFIMVIIALTVFFIMHSAMGPAEQSVSDMQGTDPDFKDQFENPPAGVDWTMDEMIINTADEETTHMIRATIIVSHEENNLRVLTELNARKSQIHDAVRTVIGQKKYAEINTTAKQQNLKQEIKTRIQMIVRMPGIYDVFFRDFSVN